MNFSISIFCSVLVARPSCSNLDVTPLIKMIKIQGKLCWKLDSNIFPTIYGTQFYHFQIIPVNSLKLAYVQSPTLAVSTLFHSLIHSFQSIHENCMIQGYLTRKLDFEQLTSRWRSLNYDVQQVETWPEVEGKRTTSLKVILSHFFLSTTSFFFLLSILDPLYPRKNEVSTII